MEIGLSPIQIIGVFLSALALTKVVADYRNKKEPRAMFFFWLSLWIIVVAFILYPQLADYIKLWLLGPDQSVGTIIGMGMVFLLFLIYRIYVKAERVERILKNHASKLALDQLDRKLNNLK